MRGLVAFSGPGLDRGLGDGRWRPLADGLAQALLGSPSLGAVAIREGALVLAPGGAGEQPGGQPSGQAPGALATRPEAVEGALELHSLDGQRHMRLPADPNIRIERAFIAAETLELHGEALVSP